MMETNGIQETQIEEKNSGKTDTRQRQKKTQTIIISILAVAIVAFLIFGLIFSRNKIKTKIELNNKRISTYSAVNTKNNALIKKYKKEINECERYAKISAEMSDSMYDLYELARDKNLSWSLQDSSYRKYEESVEQTNSYLEEANSYSIEVDKLKKTVNDNKNLINKAKNENSKLKNKLAKFWFAWLNVFGDK